MGQILTLHDPQKARGYYLSGMWQAETMYDLLLRHALERPLSAALQDVNRSLTWGQLKDWVNAVAQEFDQAGVHYGDRVSVWLSSRVETVVVLLACSRNGYICNSSLHYTYTADEVLEHLQRIGSRILVTDEGMDPEGRHGGIFLRAGALGNMRRIYALPGQAGGQPPQGAHWFPSAAPATCSRAPEASADKVVYLAFTSGTTGAPKDVLHSDNTLLANGRALAADWALKEDSVIFCLSPMSHHIGTVAIEQLLVCGGQMVVCDAASARAVPISWILDSGATYLMGVPTHAVDILAELRRRGMRSLGRVRTFYLAGVSIPREIAASLSEFGITPQNVYGMTETGSHQYTRRTDDEITLTSTCGRSCTGYEIKLWSQADPDVLAAPGEIGEIGGRGGLLMLGYFANQEATESSFNAQGWFMTGDLGALDEHGNLRIVGRKKDVIIRAGYSIQPLRIETLAERHPAIKRAAAFPVADNRLGEKVCLAVVGHGNAPSGMAILQHLATAGLFKAEMPEYYVVLSELPQTPSGKVLKQELAKWANSGRIKPLPVRFFGRQGP